MDVPSWLDFAEADALSGPRLPVWDEYWTQGGILASFAEGVTACYMWLHQITLSGEQLLVTVETILAACQEAVQ